MLRNAAILLVVAGLGAGSAVGLGACGEDREGDVEFEGGTGTTRTGSTGTGTATTPAETGAETAPETEREPEPETEREPEPETETETGASGGAEAPS